MQTVAEIPAYLANANDEGVTAAEIIAAVNTIAADPEVDEVIVGSGRLPEGSHRRQRQR